MLQLHSLRHAAARSGLRCVTTLLVSALMAGHAAAAVVGAVVKTDQVRAELIAHAPEGVVPGKPVMLGLKIEHQPEWHTYWRNPGDSGLPTTLEWSLPAGVMAGDIAWPAPKKLAGRPDGELRLRRHAGAAGID